jgi:His-Xaa-Ser system radical SAM maturase HxsC
MKLYTLGRTTAPFSSSVIARVTTTPLAERERRGDYAALLRQGESEGFAGDLDGYAAILSDHSLAHAPWLPPTTPTVLEVSHLDQLQTGDVVGVDPVGSVRFLFRKASAYNSILATERCNSRCLMCSQPPRDHDDSHRLREHLRLIELIDPDAKELGITGGEPTLLRESFIELIAQCKRWLPRTALHVLTNGRLFYYSSFARSLALIDHPDLMLGIPIYSDIDHEHDFVVQAGGAFDQTVIGLLNLARYRVPVEIRVVLHALTYQRLPELAEFIYRNLPFAAHVAFMGMEMVGYVHKNLHLLWVDPFDYQRELEQATLYLAERGMRVSVYNLQLCILPRSLWPFARKSISDWKNIYLPACVQCAAREACAGFFESAAKRHSRHIQPLAERADDLLPTPS